MYILETAHHRIVGHIHYQDMGWGQKFLKGNKVDENDFADSLRIDIENEPESFPDYFELGATPVVNRKFLDSIQRAGVDNVQVFPVTMHTPAHPVIGYHVINIVGRAPAIDVDKTDCTMHRTRMVRVNNMVLRDELSGLSMYRPDEYELLIFISDKVHDALVEDGISGIVLNLAEGWNDRHRY